MRAAYGALRSFRSFRHIQSRNMATKITRHVREIPRTKPLDTDWISDVSSLLKPADRSSLNDIFTTLNEKTKIQSAIVLIEDFKNLQPRKDETISAVKTATVDLFNFWGIGNDRFEDGLLMAYFHNQRLVHIHTGQGLKDGVPGFDLESKKIIDNVMIPFFKNGQLGVGMINGANGIADMIVQSGYKRPEIAPFNDPAARRKALAGATSGSVTVLEYVKAVLRGERPALAKSALYIGGGILLWEFMKWCAWCLIIGIVAFVLWRLYRSHTRPSIVNSDATLSRPVIIQQPIYHQPQQPIYQPKPQHSGKWARTKDFATGAALGIGVKDYHEWRASGGSPPMAGDSQYGGGTASGGSSTSGSW
jgi:uncharacterized membrane protein YgcG